MNSKKIDMLLRYLEALNNVDESTKVFEEVRTLIAKSTKEIIIDLNSELLNLKSNKVPIDVTQPVFKGRSESINTYEFIESLTKNLKNKDHKGITIKDTSKLIAGVEPSIIDEKN